MPADRLFHKRLGQSQKVSALTDFEARVWTQYILSADDFGLMRKSAASLQDDNANLEQRSVTTIARAIQHLVDVGLLIEFVHQGRAYVCQLDWQDYQKVMWPTRTLNPAPPANVVERFTDATKHLFSVFPGGKKVPKKELGSTPEVLSPTRETAKTNGLRLAADGVEGEPGEPPADPDAFAFDVAFRELKAAYPPQRVNSGHLTERAFVDALTGADGQPAAAFRRMLANLENQKRGAQWRLSGRIPKLDNWLRTGAWEQEHDEREVGEPSAPGRRTGGNVAALQAFVARGQA